ncbi:hypothetical protein INQ51_12055 [Maribellus sp. CM-23]|uniref:hypothetical protein n=1 Tax=Maribellus sp. CM-23 TaxID=2781026 RepID=UPI001F47790F|nr:hypothetical protein [Maribellus sp. CM-23]MCE4565045.1 hypothetical protein [Maribellus sp. CM-23]
MSQESPSRKMMTRKASDNKYLHKDFHLSMNILLKYIYENYGTDQMIRYLKQYTEAYLGSLNKKMKTGDINSLAEYLTDIYQKEDWPVDIHVTGEKIIIEQKTCPGISQIKAKGETPCPHYIETYNTVYNTLCQNTPFVYKIEFFDEETGACKQIFERK